MQVSRFVLRDHSMVSGVLHEAPGSGFFCSESIKERKDFKAKQQMRAFALVNSSSFTGAEILCVRWGELLVRDVAGRNTDFFFLSEVTSSSFWAGMLAAEQKAVYSTWLLEQFGIASKYSGLFPKKLVRNFYRICQSLRSLLWVSSEEPVQLEQRV